MTINPKLGYWIILLLAVVLCFYRIGVHDLDEFDEAHNGISALEMLQNGDYVNIYHNGELDSWNVKPPMLYWLIASSYTLFGTNEFALRLPSAIAAVLFFAYFFKLVELLTTTRRAIAASLILMSCKAVIGWHMALNGDFDALLLLFLTASAYHFIQFIEFDKRNAIYFTAMYTGLAFYTKGTASLLFIPGFLMYAFAINKGRILVRNYKTWVAATLFLAISGSWILLLMKYGKPYTNSFFGSKNALENMFVYDTFKRLTSDKFEPWQSPETDYFFVFHALDSRMNLWNYLFYISLLLGIFLLYKNRYNLSNYLLLQSNRIVVFSACVILPYFVILTFAKTKHAWYMAPAYGFITIITVQGAFYVMRKWKLFKWLLASVLLFTMGRHIYYLHTLPAEMHYTFNAKNDIFNNHHSVMVTSTPENILLYTKWLHIDYIKIDNQEDIINRTGELLIIEKEKVPAMVSNIKPIKYFDKYCLAIIN